MLKAICLYYLKRAAEVSFSFSFLFLNSGILYSTAVWKGKPQLYHTQWAAAETEHKRHMTTRTDSPMSEWVGFYLHWSAATKTQFCARASVNWCIIQLRTRQKKKKNVDGRARLIVPWSSPCHPTWICSSILTQEWRHLSYEHAFVGLNVTSEKWARFQVSSPPPPKPSHKHLIGTIHETMRSRS